MGVPSGAPRGGSPARTRALLLVTSGSELRTVAVGPAKTAMRGRRGVVKVAFPSSARFSVPGTGHIRPVSRHRIEFAYPRAWMWSRFGRVGGAGLARWLDFSYQRRGVRHPTGKSK